MRPGLPFLLSVALFAPTAWQLGVAGLLNLGLVAGLVRWWGRLAPELPPWLRRLVPGALGARLLLGLLNGVFESPDVVGYEAYSRGITLQLWAAPWGWWRTLTGNEFVWSGWHVVFHGLSNTFFFHKVLSFVNLLSLNSNALTAMYLTMFCFVGSLQLVRAMGRVFPLAQPGAAVGFLLWPTVAFWTSTFTKESVLLGSGAWLVAVVLPLLYAPPAAGRGGRGVWPTLAAAGLLAWLHFGMRFFFAVPLLGGLAGLALVRLAQRLGGARRRWAQAGLLLLLLGAGGWLAPQLSPAFRVNKFTSQLTKVYAHQLEAAQHRPHFEYPDLVPTPESALAHLPLAVANALVRPWLGESGRPRYVVAGLENAALLALLGWALGAAAQGRAGPLPFALVLALGFYCLAVAAQLGLTTPNLGALNRYRSAMLPYLLLLLLQHDAARRLLRRLGLG